jgi:hypothetical protein
VALKSLGALKSESLEGITFEAVAETTEPGTMKDRWVERPRPIRQSGVARRLKRPGGSQSSIVE